MRRLQPIDAAFLSAERAGMHMHVIGVLVLEPPGSDPGWGHRTVVDLLEERIHLIPPFRWRLLPVPFGLDDPRWVEDPEFDVGAHVRRVVLPSPDLDALADLVGEIAGTPLDRSRPLWDMVVVDGLPEGRIALVTKLHHAFMDGGAGGEVMASLFDLEAEPVPVDGPRPPWAPDAPPSPARLLVESPLGAIGRARSVPGALGAVSRTLPAVLRSIPPSGPATVPTVRRPTAWREPLTSERRVAFLRYPLDRLKVARRPLGATINDLVLAAATTALREELVEGDLPLTDTMLALVPISERTQGDGAFRNRTSALQVSLPVHLEDPLERLAEVRRSADEAKGLHAEMGDGALEQLVGVLPPALVAAGLAAATEALTRGLVPSPFDLVISNIAGPPIPLYLKGARVTDLYAFGPLLQGAGLNLTLLSHDGWIDIGVIGCRDDVGTLSDRLTQAFDTYVALAGDLPGDGGRSPAEEERDVVGR